jgi:hypothetical protein
MIHHRNFCQVFEKLNFIYRIKWNGKIITALYFVILRVQIYFSYVD